MRAHTGRNLVRVVERVLEKFSLTDRLLAITTNNASKNSTMRETLQQALSSCHNVFWDTKVAKVSCLAHVLSLSAMSHLLGIKVVDDREHGDGNEWQDQDLNIFCLIWLKMMLCGQLSRSVLPVYLTLPTACTNLLQASEAGSYNRAVTSAGRVIHRLPKQAASTNTTRRYTSALECNPYYACLGTSSAARD